MEAGVQHPGEVDGGFDVVVAFFSEDVVVGLGDETSGTFREFESVEGGAVAEELTLEGDLLHCVVVAGEFRGFEGEGCFQGGRAEEVAGDVDVDVGGAVLGKVPEGELGEEAVEEVFAGGVAIAFGFLAEADRFEVGEFGVEGEVHASEDAVGIFEEEAALSIDAEFAGEVFEGEVDRIFLILDEGDDEFGIAELAFTEEELSAEGFGAIDVDFQTGDPGIDGLAGFIGIDDGVGDDEAAEGGEADFLEIGVDALGGEFGGDLFAPFAAEAPLVQPKEAADDSGHREHGD